MTGLCVNHRCRTDEPPRTVLGGAYLYPDSIELRVISGPQVSEHLRAYADTEWSGDDVMKPTCAIDGCQKLAKTNVSGLCSMHTSRVNRTGSYELGPRGKPLVERFWAKVEKTEGCWLWRGTIYSNGYGVLTDGRRRRVGVHRLAYALAKGPIPDGLVIDHLCCQPICVNPDHLEAVTNSENLRRMHQRRSA